MFDPVDSTFNKIEDSLEGRLLQFYIVVEIFWAMFNTFFAMLTGMPEITVMVFLAHTVGIPMYFAIAHFTHKEALFSKLFFFFALFTIPMIWYVVGGSRASGNIMFVAELQLFTMCLRGKRQKLYIGLSIASTIFLMMLSGRFPAVVPYPLEPRQLQTCGMGIGLSTSALITLLLIRQKYEYMREQERVLKSESELKKSYQLQKNFLSNMSHEIRSPLGIVLGYNSLISEADDVEQIHEFSNTITQSGKVLQGIINDILDYSKIESGKLDIINEDYYIHKMISEIVNEADETCREKGLFFDSHIGPTLPDFLHGDSVRIKQCVTKILDNAIKFTEAGKVTLNIDATGPFRDGNYKLLIEISDTGCGIGEDAMNKIFTSFQRLDEGLTRGVEGTGLGLAITKSLINEMGGQIDVSSTPGEGTTFTVVLPQAKGNPVDITNTWNLIEPEVEPEIIVKTEPITIDSVEPKVEEVVADKPIEEVSMAVEEQPVNTSGKISVLAIDDAPMNLRLVQRMLEREDWDVTTLTSGKLCLAETQQNRYDIILLDHMMPEMDGVEVFNALKENPGMNAATPIIMLTANAVTGAEQEYMRMGFDGYISKPIDQKKLVGLIKKLAYK